MQFLILFPLLASTLLAMAPAWAADAAAGPLNRGGYQLLERQQPLALRLWKDEAAPRVAACQTVPPAPAPAAAPGELRVTGLVKDRFFNKFFQGGGKLYRLVTMQKGVPLAVVIESGIWRPAQLHAALAKQPDAMRRDGNAYLLRLPLLIRSGAGLVLQGGETLRLSRDRGVFVISMGRLQLREARLEAWDEGSRAAPVVDPEDDASFQPFVLAWSGSETVLEHAEVAGLGFHENLTQGLVFAEGPIGLAGYELPGPPRVHVRHSRLEGMYIGVRATATPDLRLCDNHFIKSRRHALHVEQGSSGLFAGNTVQETHGPYALYLSQGVKDFWVLRNDISENRRSGISIADSADLVLAGNRIRQNFDAMFLLRAERLLLADNHILDNQRHGISMRDVGPVRFQAERIGPNRGVGIIAQRSKAGAVARHGASAEDDEADVDAEVDARPPASGTRAAPPRAAPIRRDPRNHRLELVSTILEGNHSSALVLEAPYSIVLDRTDVIYPGVRRRPVFRGVLNDFESDILRRLAHQKILQIAPSTSKTSMK